MLKFLRALFAQRQHEPMEADAPPPLSISVEGAADFNVVDNLIVTHGLPVLNWDEAKQWVSGLAGEAAQAQAWAQCERAWLAHLCVALGPNYRMREQGQVLLVSTLEHNVAKATITFIQKTLARVMRLLHGAAHVPEWGHDILVVFDDEESYYRYVAHYYPEEGEFAKSGGMFISAGCSHFVTVKADLSAIEPVIAHELTHACLSHLPIPLWLNEGLAVNTEQRLCAVPATNATPQQMRARHMAFWGPKEIQQFWSGQSFARADEGNELSYDLARIMVAQLGATWEPFIAFVCAANAEDGGAAAAADHLGVQLGELAAALLAQKSSATWAPNPVAWRG